MFYKCACHIRPSSNFFHSPSAERIRKTWHPTNFGRLSLCPVSVSLSINQFSELSMGRWATKGGRRSNQGHWPRYFTERAAAHAWRVRVGDNGPYRWKRSGYFAAYKGVDELMVSQLEEVYELLNGHYVEDDEAMFRFHYSVSFFNWYAFPTSATETQRK